MFYWGVESPRLHQGKSVCLDSLLTFSFFLVSGLIGTCSFTILSQKCTNTVHINVHICSVGYRWVERGRRWCKNQLCLFAVTKLTLYVADIQTTQTAIHSMDPTHSHQGHEPKKKKKEHKPDKHEELIKHPCVLTIRNELVVTNG